MAFDPTESQRAAINEKGCILVSAAAGSGKTAVLVERVVSMLLREENPVPADRLLIVTFTNAAAAEMLSRIENRLYEEYEKNPGNETVNLQRYLIKSANICTIDSFCIKLVRDNFALCGVEPDFKVSGDKELYPARQEVLKQTVSEYIEKSSDAFKTLLMITNCKKDETALIKLIDAVYTDSKKRPFPLEYIKALKAPYTAPFDSEHIWYRSAFEAAQKSIAAINRDMERFIGEANLCVGTDAFVKHAQLMSGVTIELTDAVHSNDWNRVFTTVRASAFANSPRYMPDIMKRLKEMIKSEIAAISGLFYDTRENIDASIRFVAPAVDLLCELLIEYSNRMFERLKEENTFSFDDVEQLATGMLCRLDGQGNIVRSEHASELMSRYDEVLVDEFQDVNDLQNTLFELLSDNCKKLFVVGDIKQSIYAFRGSNPDIFLKKKNAYTDYSKALPLGGKRINLRENFRSRKEICDVVNYFFENLMTEGVGSLVYGQDEKLNCFAKYPDNGEQAADLILLDKVDDDSDDTVIESEAHAIAAYIKEIMAKGDILRGENGLRPAQYGDFCIMLGALKNKAPAIANILTGYGIPIKLSDGDFFGSTEILTALALLKVIDNPKNDVELLKILMSPVYGFSAEELANIRIDRRKMSLYSALRLYAENDSKAQAFLSDISKLRRMSCMLPVDKFVTYAIDNTDMVNVFSSMPGGLVRAENLMRLMKLASEYSCLSGGSVYGFLRYIENLPEDSVKVSGTTDSQSVKLMTIHGSKGLQFPICIVAGLSAKRKTGDSVSGCLYSGEFGIGFKYKDKDTLTKKDSLGYKLVYSRSKDEEAREKLRLMYVAMTRAEEKLCLVCCLNDAQKTLGKAALCSYLGSDAIDGRTVLSSSNYANYLLAAAILHPDAGILRKITEYDIKTKNTESHINIRFINATNLETFKDCSETAAKPDIALANAIENNIEYKYPFAALADIPAKTSVSALANKEENEYFAMTDRPAFMEKDGLSAAGKGTAAHKIMQFISFDAKVDVDKEIERLINENRISENEAAVADRTAIKTFFESPLYKRIAASDTVRREMRFLTELPVSAYGDTAAGFEDKFIVQGAVDLCFLEDDGVVVVDFKTDRVKDMSELKDRYRDQLTIYAGACEKIFAAPVKEKIIYSLSLSDTVNV